jgi:hypothetical protein
MNRIEDAIAVLSIVSNQDALSFICRVEELAQTLHPGRPKANPCKGASLCPNIFNIFMKRKRNPPGFSFPTVSHPRT